MSLASPTFSCSSPSEWRSLTVAFLYALLTPTGGLVGEIELDRPASAGEEIHVPDDRRMRIVGVVPVERIEELVNHRPSYGIILVAPVEA